VTATAYLTSGTPGTTGTLFGKGTAGQTGSEDGLGITADPTGDNEIFAGADFIQLGIQCLTGAIQIALGSTGGDTWAVYGSNTLGQLGVTSLASGGSDDGSFVTVTNATNWKYLDIKATTNNVLPQQLSYTQATPEPISFALAGTGLLGIYFMRRRRTDSRKNDPRV